MSTTDTGLVSTAEAAKLLSLTVRQVNRLARDGKLHHVAKMPGVRGPHVFSRATVVAYGARKK